MNKGKEIERFIAEYGEKPHPKSPSVTAEQVFWERELRPWLARAKLDQTEVLKEVLNDIKIFALTGHHGSHVEIVKALIGILKMIDKALAEQEEPK